MTEWVGVGVAIAVPVISAGAWLIRLEGRLNTHEGICGERYKALNERHAEVSKKLDHVDSKLDRILEAQR